MLVFSIGMLLSGLDDVLLFFGTDESLGVRRVRGQVGPQNAPYDADEARREEYRRPAAQRFAHAQYATEHERKTLFDIINSNWLRD